MTLDQKEQEIIDEFAIYDDWMDKYEYIIELGKELPIIDDQKKNGGPTHRRLSISSLVGRCSRK
jgi:sulfur transfer protein SufE